MNTTTPRDTRSPTIQVLERTFALLDMLASRQEPVSLKEISDTTGLHPSTAHRILNDLVAGRFVFPGDVDLATDDLHLTVFLQSS